MIKGNLTAPGDTYNREALANEMLKAINQIEETGAGFPIGSPYAKGFRDFLFTTVWWINGYVPQAQTWNYVAPTYQYPSVPPLVYAIPPTWGNV